MRALPEDCLESELLALCCPFAVVEKCLMISQKCQAFVQLPDTPSATNLITFYQSRDALIRGKRVFFEHSSREEVTVKPGYDNHFQPRIRAPSHDRQPPPDRHYQQQREPQEMSPPQRQQQQQSPIQYAPSSRPRQQQEPQHHYEMGGMPPPQQHAAPSNYKYNESPLVAQNPHTQRRGGGAAQPNTILMVSVTKIEYDVTADVLQQVFQKFGNVQKVVTFWKDDEFKALVQMESVPQAQAAQAALDGRDIYTGCNQLSIIFSRHPELHVRFNNEQSRDFTNPNLPSGPEPGQPGDDHLGYDQEPRGPPGMLGDVPSSSSSRHGGSNGMERERERGGGDYGRPSGSGSSERSGRGRDHRDRDNGSSASRGSDRGRSPGFGGRDDHFQSERHDSRRYDNGPPPNERSRDYNSGPSMSSPQAQLPSHSTGRSVRTEDSRSPVLICSNMDRTLVVRIAGLILQDGGGLYRRLTW